MPPQSAEQLAQRLTRVWGTISPCQHTIDWDDYGPQARTINFRLATLCDMEAGIDFEGDFYWRQKRFDLGRNKNVRAGELWCEMPNLAIYSAPPSIKGGEIQSEFDEFERDNMSLFRRNCWASGAALECSAHERICWIHELGLTEEEVTEWKLQL